MAIGPTDHSRAAPRDAFLEALYPVIDLPEAGTCDWAVKAAISFAQHREEIPYPEWLHCDNSPAEPEGVELIVLEPGGELIPFTGIMEFSV